MHRHLIFHTVWGLGLGTWVLGLVLAVMEFFRPGHSYLETWQEHGKATSGIVQPSFEKLRSLLEDETEEDVD